MAIAKKAGASRIYASDVNDFRLGLAQRMGADRVIDGRTERLDDVILKETDGFGVEVILEMSGNHEAIRQGFKALCKGGEVALLGIPSRPMELDVADAMVFKEATVRGVNGRRMFATWYKTMALLKSGLDVTPVLTERFPLDRFFDAMELQRSGNVGKIILYP
jgi:threonine 3-dehydrogenase